MKVELQIDERCKEPKIVVITDRLTEEISELMGRLSNETPQAIIGYDGDAALPLEPNDIIKIYAAVGKVFAVTANKEYVLRLRLYEAEEKLEGKNFVRISNSEIINVKKAKKFDLSTVGTIRVSLSDGSVSFVSRRYVTKIKKTLGI